MIAIKGYRHGLLIVFNGASETPWLSHLRELEAKLDANPHFFRGSSVAFDVKDAMLNEDDLRHAIDVLRTREVKLWAVFSQNAETCAHVRSLGLTDRLPGVSTARRTSEQPAPPVRLRGMANHHPVKVGRACLCAGESALVRSCAIQATLSLWGTSTQRPDYRWW